MSEATPKLNIDRWADYTKQQLHQTGWHIRHINSYYGPWVTMTPAQRRRTLKKCRKNSDVSIGVY